MVVDLLNMDAGLCDRLSRVTFCITVALLRGNNVLYVKEKPTEACPYRFIDLFEVKNFVLRPWTIAAGEMPQHFNNIFMGPNLQVVKSFKPDDLTISNKEMIRQWLGSYQLLRPKPKIQNKINSLNIRDDCIGFHIRETDKIVTTEARLWEISDKEHEAIKSITFKEIMRIARRGRLKKIFIASDNKESKLFWMNEFRENGLMVIANEAEFDANKFRQTSGEDLSIDLFALSQCRVIVGMARSMVVKAASHIRGKKNYIFIKEKKLIVLAKWLIWTIRNISVCKKKRLCKNNQN